ncbi:SLC13 family permease [Streptomyces marispadix]|uniref:Anion permease n=1 Tax=Streptomyces marispadix TaxID=2922868 RepID=A0ABS9SSA0_9ACTN|nr:SLC13 family permease [Streptomyces marispadix]MCH6159146.1 anion permease [Streptomyces marispadix]
MSDHVIAIIGLVLVFAIATFTSVHMGALAIVAAFVIGSGFVGQSADDIFGGFPGDLFVVLVGVTFLFAIAKNNGTVNWLVHSATQAVGGRIALIPWVMFLVTAVLTASGAVVPAAVGIIAPIGMGFCVRYRINPVLMGLLIINGASAGGFSPISIFGSITNGVVSRNDLDGNPTLLFLSSFLFNVLLSLVVFFLFGGRSLIGRRAEDGSPEETAESGNGGGGSLVTAGAPAGTGGEGAPETDGGTAGRAATAAKGGGTSAPATAPSGGGGTAAVEDADDATEEAVALTGIRILTLAGLVGMVVGSLFFDLDPGMMALTVGVLLTLVNPASAKGAVDACAWSTVLLVCGIVTFVTMMENMGTIDWLGKSVASINAPLLGALLICLIGAVVSAFASTTGILGALIPLAVPFLQDGNVGAVGLIIALAISSSVVDSSPFSTSGALVTANSPKEQRDTVFRRLMVWGFSMVAIAPPVTWLFFVVPGWL